jgi:hypothetical protein
MEVWTTGKSNKEFMHVLEDYLEICDSFVIMLQKTKKIGQLLSIGIM